ncbi:MAG: carbonate dehydratase [Betaproteobacteria bacterium RIFCSPLOWO2_12_FULL_65_14]|nr:MAG: carbonate dehydratase [Betaproteobacteria bacterium RIFCSPLOWO2_12_FULL_65_14]
MPERGDWHSMGAEQALEALESTRGGLASEEAAARLAAHGPNALPQARPRHPALRFLSQFNNALIYFLLAAAVAAAVLGHLVDAAVIAAVILINALVGFVQEGKAEQALEAMRKMISPRASVLRDGVRRSVPVPSLVPGDVVLLDAGDRVPADLRLLRARGLLIDEALLTGESVPAEKKDSPAPSEADLGARHSMAYSGTLVVAGQAAGVVAATGPASEIGRISALLQSVEPLTTPLLRQINRFGRQFTWVVFSGAGLLFLYAVLVHGYDWVQALIAVVALAVAAIPEGLPAVITITLAIGVRRMAARNAVIRRLPAVETLGATSVICSDKTGTLTRNEMTAVRIVTREHEARVSGAGYAPDGDIEALGHDDDAACLAAAMPVIRCGLLCNDAHLRQHEGAWGVEGDPMEGALIALARKAGLNPDHVRAEWPRLDEIPFDARYRFMAALHRGPEGEATVFVKGAPEQLLDMAQAPERAWWMERMAQAAAAGERVLGFAAKRLNPAQEELSHEAVAQGLGFLGLVGFIDPPREEAIGAIAECRSAGITVKMITGDHAATASAIARELRLADDPKALTGAELDRLPDDEFAARVHESAVFARTSPEHKLRIVRALQARGAVVAMTGDGVNDAPSLKQADVGVAMGIKGTEASKEAAEMVLLDDNFASIVNAVHEGRTVYDNIRKVISWTLPTNGGEVMIVMVALLFGLTLPMTAAQILWVNLITSVTLGLALAFEPSEPGVMQRPPRPAGAPLLSRFLVWRVGLVSLLFFAACLGVFMYALRRGDDVETARTLVVNTLVVLEAFYLFNVRYLHTTSITWRGALGTPAVLYALGALVVAQLVFTYAPPMHDWFHTRPLRIQDGLLAIAIGIALMLLLEGEKALLRRLGLAPPGAL